MSPLGISRASGLPALPQKLQDYFTGVFQAEDSGEEFSVSLEHVWRITYPRKDHALRALRKKFMQDIDYQVLQSHAENPLGGRPEALYQMSVSCLEYFTVRANRKVFGTYCICCRALRTLVTRSHFTAEEFALPGCPVGLCAAPDLSLPSSP